MKYSIITVNFNNKDEFQATNIRRIIVSLREDARIVIIKLSDRLHNMCTMEYKPSPKKAEETLQVFAPLAYLFSPMFVVE